jgi:hypothetical protein
MMSKEFKAIEKAVFIISKLVQDVSVPPSHSKDLLPHAKSFYSLSDSIRKLSGAPPNESRPKEVYEVVVMWEPPQGILFLPKMMIISSQLNS